MQHFIDEFKSKKYRVAMFESGEQNLVEKTKDLLVHYKGLENKCSEWVSIQGLIEKRYEVKRKRKILPHIFAFYPKCDKMG